MNPYLRSFHVVGFFGLNYSSVKTDPALGKSPERCGKQRFHFVYTQSSILFHVDLEYQQ